MTLEDKIKEKILSEHKSLRAFAKKLDMPYTSLATMLKRGISGASVTSIIKICQELEIDIDALTKGEIKSKPRLGEFSVSKKEQVHIQKYRSLDDGGKKMVDVVLELEYEKSTNKKQNLHQENKFHFEVEEEPIYKEHNFPLAAHLNGDFDDEAKEELEEILRKLGK